MNYYGKWSMYMCAERLWYILVAILMGFVMGLAGSQMFAAAFVIQLAIMGIMLMRGFSGFCPSVMIFKQFLPPCNTNE